MKKPSVTPGGDAAPSRAAAGDAIRRPSIEVTSLEYSADPSRTDRADACPSPLHRGDGGPSPIEQPDGGPKNPASPMEGFDGAERQFLRVWLDGTDEERWLLPRKGASRD